MKRPILSILSLTAALTAMAPAAQAIETGLKTQQVETLSYSADKTAEVSEKIVLEDDNQTKRFRRRRFRRRGFGRRGFRRGGFRRFH